ncbi:MAG: hypothetical protein WDA18_08395 [Candidatus Ratteibacteria bacterium]
MKKNRTVFKIRVQPVAAGRNDLSWDTVSSADSYRIYRMDKKGVSFLDKDLLGCVKGNSFEDRSSVPSLSYYYAVVACKKNSAIAVAQEKCQSRSAGLEVFVDGSVLVVRGANFEVSWDLNQGGEIFLIRQYDGVAWFPVNDVRKGTVPNLTFTIDRTKIRPLASCSVSGYEFEKRKEGEVVFLTRVDLGICKIRMRWTIFQEGVIFCEMRIPDSDIKNDKTQGVDSAANKRLMARLHGSLGLSLDPMLVTGNLRWGYFPRLTGSAEVGKRVEEKIEDRERMLPLALADYRLEKKPGFTNHLEIFVEDSPPSGASTHFGADGKGGLNFEWNFSGKEMQNAYFTCWDMGFFLTRWGLCLGGARTRASRKIAGPLANNLLGAKIFHIGSSQGVPEKMRESWPFNSPPVNMIRGIHRGMSSNSDIRSMKKEGADTIVYHQSWMRSGGSNCDPPADYIPRNSVDLKRFVDGCHSQGMKVGLYMRGAEKHAFFQPYFEKFLQRDFDGLYVDWGSPLSNGYHGCNELHFCAYTYFLFTRALRERVGDEGFLISHTGSGSTMLAWGMFDAYLPGEAKVQKKGLEISPEEASYFGVSSAVGTNPLRINSERTVAFYAGLGFSPHLGPKARFAALFTPLWRMMDSFIEKETIFYSSYNQALSVAKIGSRALLVSVYRISRERIFAVIANTGSTRKASLALDTERLGMTGGYKATIMRVSSKGTIQKRPVKDLVYDGKVEISALQKNEYCGVLFERKRPLPSCIVD